MSLPTALLYVCLVALVEARTIGYRAIVLGTRTCPTHKSRNIQESDSRPRWVTSKGTRSVFVVVVAGPGVRQRRGLAHRLPVPRKREVPQATRGLAERASAARVERAAAYALRWSDYAPVTVEYSPVVCGRHPVSSKSVN
jgi:hypothetical protein